MSSAKLARAPDSVLHRFRNPSFPFLPRRICYLSSERNAASWTRPGRKLRQRLLPIATNLALFVLSAAAYALVGLLAQPLAALRPSLAILQSMTWIAMYVNLFLAFFNLIPLPPLDGSHVLKLLLPPTAGMQFRQLYALGMIPILIVVWFLPGVVNTLMWPAYQLLAAAFGLVGGFQLHGALPS